MRKDRNIRIILIALLLLIAALMLVFGAYRAGILGHFAWKRQPSLTVISVDDLIPYTPEAVCQNLILVNGSCPLPDDFEANIGFYKDTDVLMNNEIIESYSRLSSAVREQYNDKLYVSSSYRSYEDQVRVYNEEGPEIAALPGTSEHQTGLALDVYVMYFAGMGFIDSPVGRYVNSSCQDYGFIIRYPQGAQDITGFEYEPWHIRYVGFPHSHLIADAGITLEEYIDFFDIGKWYGYENYLISRQPVDDIKIPAAGIGDGITVSPDNTGFVFVTITLDQNSPQR